MTDTFKAEFYTYVYKEDGEIKFTYIYGSLLSSSIENLEDMAWLEADCFDPFVDNYEELKELAPDKEYRILMDGTVWFDKSYDSEGNPDGEWYFEWNEDTLEIKEIK